MWVKLDDAFPYHEKLLGVSPEAAILYVGSLCYAARFRTDGRVPKNALPILWPTLKQTGSELEALASELLEAVLWVRVDDDISIHDFLDYNPTHENLVQLRETRAEAGRKGGKRSGEARRKSSQDLEKESKQVASNNEASASSKPEAFADPPSNPVPSRPVPSVFKYKAVTAAADAAPSCSPSTGSGTPRGDPGSGASNPDPDADADDEPAPSKSRRRRTHANRRAVIAAWHERFVAATGSRPTWNAKNRGLCDGLARAHDLAEILRRFDRVFRERPRSVWFGGVPDIGLVASRFDTLVHAEASSPLAGVRRLEDAMPSWARDDAPGGEP